MRVKCKECNNISRITSKDEQSPEFATLYCACSDPTCGHTFTMLLTFKETLSPSSSQAKQLMLNLLSMPENERTTILAMINKHQ